jgi:predicted glycosyltransferase
MNIWFDLSNSPHINLFAALIRDLMHDHKVIITCRPLANTTDLLDLHKFEYTVVGKHYGRKISNKLMGYPVRVFQLIRFLRKNKVDIGITQSTFTSSIAARISGIPFIYMNDNEHAMGNIPSFVFANRILVPEFIHPGILRRQLALKSKIIRYPGVKEGIYLWNMPVDIKNGSVQKIYVRPEPWIAQYYSGAINFLDDLLLYLQDRVSVVLLPRGKEQSVYYKQEKFKNIEVMDIPLSLGEIAAQCSLFIGAGGTMTREMAVLGIPTISVYQDKLLSVDKYLIDNGIMMFKPDLSGEEVIQFLQKNVQKGAARDLLVKGEKTYQLIRDLLTNKFSHTSL